MRTLPAELEAALDNNAGSFFFRAEVMDLVPNPTPPPTDINGPVELPNLIYYKLERMELEVRARTSPLFLPGHGMIRVVRGVIIEGTEYAVTSPWYFIQSHTTDQVQQRITIKAHIFPPRRFTTAGDVEANEAIQDIFNQMSTLYDDIGISPLVLTAIYNDHIDWWQDLQFLPTGRTLTLNRGYTLENLLRQKYLVLMFPQDGQEIKLQASSYNPQHDDDNDGGFDVLTIQESRLLSTSFNPAYIPRSFFWRDETDSLHWIASTSDTLHNMGFMPTGAAPRVSEQGRNSLELAPPDLRVLGGDLVTAGSYPRITTADPVEIFDTTLASAPGSGEHRPPWYQEIKEAEFIDNTEGGAMPSTIMAVAPYTPLDTSSFNKALDAQDNNVQAAFSTLDDHAHETEYMHLLEQEQTVYVSKAGIDSADGLTVGTPVRTIGAAITIADTLIAGGAPAVNIEIQDAGTYAESFTVKTNTRIIGLGATIQGAVTMESDCVLSVDVHQASASSQILVNKVGATGCSFYFANILDTRGPADNRSSNTGIRNISNGSIIFARIGQLFVGPSSVGMADSAAGFGHIHFWAADLYLAGNSAIGISAVSDSTNIIGYIDHILEVGTPTTTTGIYMNHAGAIIKATITEIIVDAPYNIAAGSLHLVCSKLTGTVTGSAVFEVSPHYITHDHAGTNSQKLAQANTHESPDTDSAAGSLHHTIGAGATQAAAGNHQHLEVYALQGSAAVFNPTDGQTVYFGGLPSEVPTTTSTRYRIVIPKAGTIRRCQVHWNSFGGAAGSNETITANLMLNGSGTTLIGTAANTQAAKNIANANMNIAVALADYVEVELVFPTWGTNPTSVHLSVVLTVEVSTA